MQASRAFRCAFTHATKPLTFRRCPSSATARSLSASENRLPAAVFLPLMNEMRRGVGGENTPSPYSVSRSRLVLSKQRIRD